jgi:hypothetical protein
MAKTMKRRRRTARWMTLDVCMDSEDDLTLRSMDGSVFVIVTHLADMLIGKSVVRVKVTCDGQVIPQSLRC